MDRLALVLPLALIACPAPDPDDTLDTDNAEPFVLAERVEVDALMAHLEALEAIGDDFDGTRMTLSDGYEGSVDYARSLLEDAGYTVTLDPYATTRYVLDAAAFEEGETAYELGGTGADGFEVFPGSASGDVTAEAVPVDVVIPAPAQENGSDSGCEAGDFDGFPSGAIALLQRGTCTFASKVENAVSAGAAAVVIFNEGQPGRTEPLAGIVGAGGTTVPVLGISYALGEALSAGGITVRVMVDGETLELVEHNVIAETPGGDPDRVVMVGAHFDSVPVGPGINDNGSGSALVIEAALQVAAAGYEPPNKIRFALWGAEEVGLVGSWHWMHDEETELPDPARLQGLLAYLNYDMIASGNGYRFVYDGDGDQGGSAGSAAIERVFLDWFADRDQLTSPTGLFLPSDSYWFAAAGIPTGGLFSGASGAKTQSMAGEIGGVAGEDLDPCYHQACDRVANVDPVLFGELAAPAAHAIQVLAEWEGELAGAQRADFSRLPRFSGCHDHVRWDR